jgi:mono/diheme cytochrome c family protein
VKHFHATALISLALVVSAQAQESGEPRRGLAVARTQCAGCHAVGRGESRSALPTAPPFERVANTPGMTPIALNHLLHSSHETMPNIILSADDESHLVAYIWNLRKN